MPTYDNARFAISGLPRAQQANALEGEIMVDHDTGMYFLKGKDGQSLSIDSVLRQRVAVNTLTSNIRLFGNRQMNIYELQLGHLTLPTWVTTGLSFLTDRSSGTDVLLEQVLPTGLNELMFHIDADALDANLQNELSLRDSLVATITLQIEYTNASNAKVTVPYTITGAVRNVNSTLTFIDEIIPAQFRATSIVTIKTMSLTMAAPTKILLHGVLIASK